MPPYDPNEMFAAGSYPNQHPGGEGLPKWTQANRSICLRPFWEASLWGLRFAIARGVCWVKPDYRLVGFLYRAAPNGAGIIFALPAELSTTAHLQKALAQATVSKPPRPEGAMPHFMAAIDGDRSAASFMVASLLAVHPRQD
ncbi:hypothetical protein [Leptolyngbya ohadii]|uniref:hypothetical protein n=1 Tax=Leptolyngbya ohadii TaxID=1962290 RepID=UPI000B59953A|nr:hypothetical protein [Leptolyngbya ohadii]